MSKFIAYVLSDIIVIKGNSIEATMDMFGVKGLNDSANYLESGSCKHQIIANS